jgi:hypothetical protein
MCDYSLESVKSEKARQGASYKLDTFSGNPTFGSKGFKAAEDCAACVPEGTVLRIEVPERMQYEHGVTAIEDVLMVRLDKDVQYRYHDAVQFEGGRTEKLQQFPVGTSATVLVLGNIEAPEDNTLASPAPEVSRTFNTDGFFA